MKTIYKSLTLLAFFAILFMPTNSAQAQGPGTDGGRVIFGENFTLDSGETLSGGLVVFGGNVAIKEDATLTGGLVVFGGTVTSNGTVDGDIVIIGGQVKLDEKAHVTGDVVTVGGQVERAEGARVEGDVLNNVSPKFGIPNGKVPPGVPDINVPNIVNSAVNPFWEFAKAFGAALLVAFLGVLATLFFQERLTRVSQAIVAQPLMASSIGLLTIVALVLTGVTIILLPVALLGLIPLGFAWLFGVIAIGQEIGERFAKAVRQDWAPVITTGLGTFILVLLVSSVQATSDILWFTACVTWIIPVLIGLLAIGAVVLTRFGAQSVQTPAMIAPISPTDSGQVPPAS